MNHFYRDLPTGHIRVLTIHPGDETTSLSGVLRSVPLASAPDFEAVSYAWGNEDFTDTLNVAFSTEPTSGEQELTGGIPVTPNVTSLLRSLRSRDEPRVLWIDAICINQANVSERSAQVRQMRQIYSCAQRVIVWLGLATEDGESDRAFRFLRRMGTFKKRHEPRDYLEYVPDEISESSHDGSSNLSDLERVSDIDEADCDEEDEGSQSSLTSDESDPESAGLLKHDEQTQDSSSNSLQNNPAALGDLDRRSNIEVVHSYDKEGEFSDLSVLPLEDDSKPRSAAMKPDEPIRSIIMAGFFSWLHRWITRVSRKIVLTFAPLASLGFKTSSDQESMSFSRRLQMRRKQKQAAIHGESSRTWDWALECMKFWEHMTRSRARERAEMAVAVDNDLHRAVDHVAIGFSGLCYMFAHPLAPFFHKRFQSHWAAVDSLLTRQWWSRTWVVQEVWSASDRAILQCGQQTLRWKTFRRAMSYSDAWDDMGQAMRENQDSRVGLWTQLQRRYGLAIHLCKMRLLEGKLSDLLWNTWDRDATDPRDKVFAVLGLVGESTRPLMSPDYGKTVKQVFCETARDIIRAEGSLDILLAAGGTKGECDEGILPSWVPDWRKEANETRPVLFVNRARLDSPYWGGSMDFAIVFGHGYAACADEKAVAWFGKDLMTLHTHAVLIDEISSWCGTPQGSGPIEVESIIGNAYAIARNALDEGTQYWWIEDEREKVEVREQLWGNGTGENEMQAQEIALQVIVEKVLCAGSAAESTVAQVVQNVMPLRRFFVTKEERYLGIGPASIRPGDKVFVIAGCNFPLILREIADENGHGTGEFELVGESYVHGIMAGEAISRMKETAWWEDVVQWLFPKTVKWREIVIR